MNDLATGYRRSLVPGKSAGVRAHASTAATIVLVVCAVVVTALSLMREFGRGPVDPPPFALEPAPNWLEYANGGHRIGPPNAAAVIVEFGDYQCPACRSFHRALLDVREQHPQDFAIVYHHFPLTTMHPFALDAAVASECAAEQGRFEHMHSALYENQGLIGVWSWQAFAARSGVQDSARFLSCLRDSAVVATVQRNVDVARQQLGLRATPTSMMNGVRFSGMPPRALFDSLLKETIAAGKRR